MEVHHCVQQSLPLIYNLSQINAVNVMPSIFCDVHFNTILPSIPGSSEWSPSVRVPHQTLHTFLPIHPTCSLGFDHPNVWWECSFYTFYSSSCYLWNWISDIKWLVGRIGTTEQINEDFCALCEHTMKLCEDYCLLGWEFVWSVIHKYPSMGCIPKKDAVSIFRVDSSMQHHHQKCQYTCTSLHAIISHKTFILTAFEGSKLKSKMPSPAVNYLTTAVANS